MDIESKISVKNFVSACNELVKGKFILADIKISKILRAISESNEIYNLIAENMINYDFDREFKTCLVKDSNGYEKFELPKQNEKLVPLVFCLLVEMDSKRVNFDDFVKAQFPLANNQNEEYDDFAKKIIIPFRNAVAESLGVEVDEDTFGNLPSYQDVQAENNEISGQTSFDFEELSKGYSEEDSQSKMTTSIEHVDEKETKTSETDESYLLLERIVRLTKVLQDKLVNVRNPLKKSNIGLLLDALLEACKLENVKIIIAVVMALNTFAGGEKNMKSEIKELNIICYDFYE